MLWTSPQKEPTGLGASRSCITTTLGSGISSIWSNQSGRGTFMLLVGGESAAMTAVAA